MKASELAGLLGTTAGFVRQVVGPLVERGWVRSDPGPTGGYTCLVDVAEVSVLDVIEAVEGPTDAGGCVLEGRPCDDEHRCALHGAWQVARGSLLRSLADTPMASLPAPGAPA